ncbi:MAG: S9 family peptidase [Sediminibacterium sp.]|nr:S9 family peptidase [Sediminibacterium sp.]
MEKPNYQWPRVQAPVAPIHPIVRTLHGESVTDNYYWMIDYFRKGPESKQVVAYLEAENAYTEVMLKGTRNFQDALFNEMKARIKEKDETVPVFKNGYYYYTRTEEGKQYYKYCRKKGSLSAPEEILLDVDAMAEGKKYYNLSGFTVSENNELLAYGVDELSRRQYTIEIKNLVTGAVYAERIAGTGGDPVWAADNATLFYTANNPVSLLSEKIKKHRLGTAPSDDVVVYEETDKSNYIGVEKSKNNRYIFIVSQATLSSETWYIPTNQPDAAFQCFQPRMKEVLYDVYALDDRFLIMTNQYALNFRLMETPLNLTTSDHWKEIIPHRSDVLLQGLEVFQHFIVINERKHGLASLRVRELSSGNEHYIHFEEAAYTAAFHANPEFSSNTLRYSYTSLTTPASIYDYDLRSREQQLKKRQEVLGGYSPEDYATERIDATAADGRKIPISIVYRKGFEKNGKAPLLLYAYGAYGISMDVGFNSARLSLLNRGFAFAVAHIRGGQDLGRQWYEDGKLMKKLNTFTDFIACGRHLVQERYTAKEHLYAQGGSAGGLLIGAVLNMAPDLWNGAIAQVPFVDVINTMLDESIPLTTNEFDEWGNPKNKEAYLYMKQYSPYENIAAKAYPHLLVTTGLHDSQVQYFEPAKWVARLRAVKKDRNVLLLHTNMHVGHGGASGRFDYLKDIAMNFAFLFALEDIQE